MRFLLIFVALFVISGCASMADSMSQMAGVGVISEKKSTFDGAYVIELSPAWLYDPQGGFGNNYKLGARWTDAVPESVAIILNFSSSAGGNAYTSFSGIDINIDGAKYSFDTTTTTTLSGSDYNTVSNTIYTESENTVVIPLALLKQMTAATDCRLRIHSSDGYEDALFHLERMPGGQGLAKPRFVEFLNKVDSAIN